MIVIIDVSPPGIRRRIANFVAVETMQSLF